MEQTTEGLKFYDAQADGPERTGRAHTRVRRKNIQKTKPPLGGHRKWQVWPCLIIDHPLRRAVLVATLSRGSADKTFKEPEANGKFKKEKKKKKQGRIEDRVSRATKREINGENQPRSLFWVITGVLGMRSGSDLRGVLRRIGNMLAPKQPENTRKRGTPHPAKEFQPVLECMTMSASRNTQITRINFRGHSQPKKLDCSRDRKEQNTHDEVRKKIKSVKYCLGSTHSGECCKPSGCKSTCKEGTLKKTDISSQGDRRTEGRKRVGVVQETRS